MGKAIVASLCSLAFVAALDMMLVGRHPRTVLLVLGTMTAAAMAGIVSWVAETTPDPSLVMTLLITGVFVVSLFVRIYHRAVERYEQE